MTSGIVRVRVPPDADHVPLLRTAVAGVAARMGFTLEEVDDLRMGVEEAAVLLLRHGGASPLELDLLVDEGAIEASVAGDVEGDGDAVDRESFSWTILAALVDEVRTERDGASGRIVLVKRAQGLAT